MNAVLQSATPNFSPSEAEALTARHFAVRGVARLLTSERDQNFHIAGVDGRAYVLKIANAAEDTQVVAFQNAVLEHIAAADGAAPTPRVVRTPQGADTVSERGSYVRLLTWLAGTLMHQAPRTTAMRASLGETHARLALAMRGCDAPAPAQELMWDLQHAARLRPLLEQIDPVEDRAMLTRVLDRFEEAAPVLRRQRAQVIHSDLNPHNVVLGVDGLVSGVIDFGDMVRAPLVCDVAIAAAYHVRPDLAPLADAAEYVAAFDGHLPLAADELALLPVLIETRLAMTALITNWRAARYPQNRDYILRNAPTAWAGLRAMSAPGARLEIVR